MAVRYKQPGESIESLIKRFGAAVRGEKRLLEHVRHQRYESAREKASRKARESRERRKHMEKQRERREQWLERVKNREKMA